MAQIISTNHRPQFCTARYKVFSEPKPVDDPHGEVISMTVKPEMLKSGVEILSTVEKPKDIDISESDVIVAVGRGAMTESLRAMAKELADALGGVLACTRPLAEANILDAKHQIGLSGRTVKPKFILCLGISGAVQFAAGMKSSDCIVAVNTDPTAPIFDVAHYGIVGDVNEILPGLLAKIKEAKADV
jgi:electron transfer flavoprotein alpha subunit